MGTLALVLARRQAGRPRVPILYCGPLWVAGSVAGLALSGGTPWMYDSESGAASRPTSGSERVLQRAVQEIAVPGRPRLPDELPGEEVAVACVEL